MKVVRELEPIEVTDAIHPRRRIVVLERDDGRFAFAEEHYYVSEYEGEVIAEGWHQHPANGTYETADMAEQEGRAAFAKWHRLSV
ncbi:MAG: hypothetical protein R3C25_01260 [Hyphomonadaceae bacterium]